jgi:hypothetical protein
MTPPCWRKARKIRQKAANRAAERLLGFKSSLPKCPQLSWLWAALLRCFYGKEE